MTATLDVSAPTRITVATAAAIVLAIYAVFAAWFVLAATADPPALEVEWTESGAGVIVRGAIDDEQSRAELLRALGELTGAELILNDVEIDPDADPADSIEQTARRLARSLPDRRG